MFTGIVEEMGIVTAVDGPRLEIACGLAELLPGVSVAVDGVCLTVTWSGDARFAAEISPETAARSTLGDAAPGRRVNLERPLAASGRFGGHIVQGHVDATARVEAVAPEGPFVEMSFSLPPELARYLVEKGSVAVDGVSLTVASASGETFSAALVPYTLDATTLGQKRAGDKVNIEVDVLAKYVERLIVREDL